MQQARTRPSKLVHATVGERGGHGRDDRAQNSAAQTGVTTDLSSDSTVGPDSSNIAVCVQLRPYNDLRSMQSALALDNPWGGHTATLAKSTAVRVEHLQQLVGFFLEQGLLH